MSKAALPKGGVTLDYSALALELGNATYSGLSDQAAADIINAKTIVQPLSVALSDVRGTLYTRGKWGAVVKSANAARANADSSDAAIACQILYDAATAGGTLAMGDSAVSAQATKDLTAMVEASVLVPDDVTAILAIAEQTVPWAPMVLGSMASDYDVGVARAV